MTSPDIVVAGGSCKDPAPSALSKNRTALPCGRMSCAIKPSSAHAVDVQTATRNQEYRLQSFLEPARNRQIEIVRLRFKRPIQSISAAERTPGAGSPML